MDQNDLPPDGFNTPTGLPSLNAATGDQPPDGYNTPVSNSNDLLTPRGKSIVHAVTSPLLKYGGAATGAVLAAPEAAVLAAGTGGAAIPLSAAAEVGAGTAGFTVGASLSDQLDQLIGYAPPPSDIKDSVKKTFQNVKEGAENELGSRIISKPLEAGVGALGTGLQKLTAAATSPEALQQVSDLAKKVGVDLSPAELANTKMLKAVEKIFDNLPWTSTTVNDFRLQQLKQLNTARENLIAKNGNPDEIENLGLAVKNEADKFIQKVGTVDKTAMGVMKNRLLQKVGSKSTYDDLDISAKEAVQRYQQDLHQQTDAAYTKVRELAPQDQVVPESTLKAAQKIIDEQERVAPSARNKTLYNTARSLIQTADDVPTEVRQMYENATPVNKAVLEEQFPGLTNPGVAKSYQDLSANISAFNAKKYAQIDTSHGAYKITNEGRQWDDLIKGLHDDMGKIIDTSENSDLIQANSIAKQLYLKKMALFQDPAFKTINDKYPGAVAKSILQSGSNDLIQRYRALTGETLFTKAKNRLTNDLLGLNEGDIVKGDDIRANVLKLGDTVNSIYTPTELGYFQKLANAVDLRKGATNELLNNPLLKKMTTGSSVVPSGIAKAVVTPENPGAAKAVEHILGSSVKKKVADAFLPHLLSTNQNGDFLPQTFATEYNKYGYKTLEAWYGTETATELKNLAQISEKAKGAQDVATGKSTQPGWKYLIGLYGIESALRAGATALTNPSMHAVIHLGGDATVVLGSRQLAKLYTSPEGKTLFLHGLITPRISKDTAILTSRILAAIGNTGYKKLKGE